VKGIGFISSGDGSQLQTYADYSAYLDGQLYLRTLDRVDLTEYRALVVPDFSNQKLLRLHARQINDYLAQGGFLIAFEPNRIDQWLDVVKVPFFERETENWKWWMVPGGRLEVYQPEPKHPMAKAISVAAMSWHFFGAFRFVDGATPILNLDNDEGCIMYDQRLAGGGRLIVSSLDPHSHHGRGFMPATTRFLNGFYPWLKAETAGP
jgi:hypothetical protein